ncbi:MAG: hypothetical protein JWL83_2748 [Actinomycetia bacterium]|nr:hypothetical protein [Actinomycetes bacterium]
MQRIEAITKFFTDYASDATIVVAVTSAEWAAHAAEDPTKRHHPFGFLPEYEDDTGRHRLFCPELMERQTLQLDDEQLRDYVETLAYHVNVHLVHAGAGWTDVELERMIEDSLMTIQPVTANMVALVQMDALN